MKVGMKVGVSIIFVVWKKIGSLLWRMWIKRYWKGRMEGGYEVLLKGWYKSLYIEWW